VNLDGVLLNPELFGDFPVEKILSDELQDVCFAGREGIINLGSRVDFGATRI